MNIDRYSDSSIAPSTQGEDDGASVDDGGAGRAQFLPLHGRTRIELAQTPSLELEGVVFSYDDEGPVDNSECASSSGPNQNRKCDFGRPRQQDQRRLRPGC